MKNKINFSIFCIIMIAFSAFSFNYSVKDENPYPADNLIEPADLAKILNGSSKQPVVINVGPMQHIKGAHSTGIGGSSTGMSEFKTYVSKFNKDQFIVLYCGCCAMKTCPNVSKPYEYLRDAGYDNFKMLNIKSSLSEEWVSKGYPMN